MAYRLLIEGFCIQDKHLPLLCPFSPWNGDSWYNTFYQQDRRMKSIKEAHAFHSFTFEDTAWGDFSKLFLFWTANRINRTVGTCRALTFPFNFGFGDDFASTGCFKRPTYKLGKITKITITLTIRYTAQSVRTAYCIVFQFRIKNIVANSKSLA